MKKTIFAVVLCSCVFILVKSQHAQPCQRSSPEVNKCLRNFFNNWFTNFVENDVFRMNNSFVALNQGAINVNSTTKNLFIRGITQSNVVEVKNDLKNLVIAMKLKTPKIEIKGLYETRGVVLAIPANTRGKFYMRVGIPHQAVSDSNNNVEFLPDGITQIFKLKLTRVERNGRTYFKIRILDYDFIVKGAKLKLQEELQKEFQQILTDLFNANSVFFVSQFKDQMADITTRVFSNLLQRQFDAVSENQIFMD